MPVTLISILGEIGRLYAPLMVANAAAIAAGDKTVECDLDAGRVHWVQPSFSYQSKCYGCVHN